jgi:3-hydroxyisobutyrate dehydrogenase-like beta-hydroxyacid dehydrogenase
MSITNRTMIEPLRIGFLGFGEAGRLLADELAEKPGVFVSAYDILFATSGVEGKVTIFDRLDAFCAHCAIIISVVTADQAVRAAEAAAPHLKPAHVFLDFNSVAPDTKRDAAALIAARGAGYVDCAVMANVFDRGIAVPILAGGPAAARMAAILNPLGMTITVVSSQIGRASATKLCRSIVIKGMEALMADFSAAADASGVFADVVASLNATFPGVDFAALAETMPGRLRQHGIRRAAEMREAGEMLDALGLDGDLSRAIAARQERGAERSVAEPIPRP